MACNQSTGESSQQLQSNTSDWQFAWFTGWIPKLGVDEVKGVLRSKVNVSGNPLEVQTIIQYAAVRPNEPDDPANLEASSHNGNGEWNTGIVSLSGVTTKLWFRIGVKFKRYSGTAMASATVSLEISYNQCGQTVGSSSFDLEASATTRYYALTPWLLAIFARTAMSALVVSSVTGNFRCTLVYRTAETSKEEPGSWTATADSNHDGAGEYNTGQQALAVSTDMWVQVGLKVTLSSGTTEATASVTTMTAVKK